MPCAGTTSSRQLNRQCWRNSRRRGCSVYRLPRPCAGEQGSVFFQRPKNPADGWGERPRVQRHFSNILVVRTDRLGDVLLTLPVFAALMRLFPDARRSFLLQSYTADLIEGHPLVDEVIRFDGGASSGLREKLKRHEFDCAVIAHATWTIAWSLFLSRIPVRVGTGYRPYSFLFTHRRYEHRHTAERHESEYCVNLLRTLGLDTPPVEGVPIPVSGETLREVAAAVSKAGLSMEGPLVVLHPGSGGSAWAWPVGRFAELGRLLIARGVSVALTGSKPETEAAGRCAQDIGSPAVSLAGLFTLKQLAAFFKMAGAVVANSTGPLHLAASVGTPVIGLYPDIPPMTPRRWGPLTETKRIFAPAHAAGRSPRERMMGISAREVCEAACGFLEVAHAGSVRPFDDRDMGEQ